MPLNKVYQLIHRQTFVGQEIINVYFYNHNSGAGGAGILAAAFADDLLPAINDIQCSVIRNVELNVFNLDDLSDFANLALADGGTNAGESLPPTDAVGFTFKLNTRAVRPGSKRICGVPEAAQNAGSITNEAYLAQIEVLRLALADDVTGVADSYSPVVLKRVKTAIPGTSPVEYTYRLPATDAQLVMAGITSVLTTPFVTSQVSRKRRGS